MIVPILLSSLSRGTVTGDWSFLQFCGATEAAVPSPLIPCESPFHHSQNMRYFYLSQM